MKSMIMFLVILSPLFASALDLATFEQRPKLVVSLVIDQFRADYLTRFGDRFKPAGSMEKPGGFRFLMKEGAYFPFAEYDVLQCMTCPGHAMILTGTRPARFGFNANDWYDRKSGKLRYCAEDAEHGTSPRLLIATTVGDELKGVKTASRVVSLALKDRAAVMLGGHNSDVTIWVDEKSGLWATSTYYNKGALPAWVDKLNAGLKADAKRPNPEENTLEAAKYGTKLTLDAAASAVREMKLGRGKTTDLLAVSLSNHDLLGHMRGPNSPDMENLTLEEDRLLAEFFGRISNELGGLKDVVIALTADHGIPPTPDVARAAKLDSGRIDWLSAFRRINERLDKKFGSSGKAEWIKGNRLMNLFFNDQVLVDKKINRAEAENEAREALLQETGVAAVYTRTDYERGYYPPGPLGEQIKNSYIDGLSGDLVVVPRPYFTDKTTAATTHITGYAYDRQVPLILVGRAFKPGVYNGALVIDLAPTLSFVMGVLAPATSEGRVLKEALR